MSFAPTGKSLSRAIVAASSSGNNEIVAAVAGKRIVVYGWELLTRAAVVVKWRTASTDLTGAMSFGVGGSWSKDLHAGGEPYLDTAEGEALNLNLDAAQTVNGTVWYLVK